MGGNFDVVILSWNRVHDTLAAIHSALGQDGVQVMVHVVDQASDPDQIRILQQGTSGLPRVQVHYLDRNAGVPEGRNIGARLGTGETILFLDNDAEFEGSDVCSRVDRLLAEAPEITVVSLLVMNYFTGDLDETSWNHARPIGEWARKPFYSTRFTGGGFAIRRADFEAMGGFDPLLQFMEEEKDLGYRLIEAGRLILHAPTARIRHKVSPERRVTWSSGRTYYLSRNIIYCEYKFGTSWKGLALATAEVMRIARRKGSILHGLKGAAAGHLLGFYVVTARRRRLVPLSPRTRDYINEHETRFYAAGGGG